MTTNPNPNSSGHQNRPVLGRLPPWVGATADLIAIIALLFFGEMRQIAVIAGILGLVLGFFVIHGRRGQPLTAYPAGLAILAMIVGSVVATGALVRPVHRNESQPVILIDSVREGGKVRNPAPLSGRFDSPLGPGETLWVYVGYGELSDGKPATYQLLQGPCSTAEGVEGWTCPHYPLQVDKDRDVSFHFISAQPSRAQEFVRLLLDGARLDEFNTLCKKYNFCPENPSNDPRSSSALPGGDGVTFLRSISLTLTP